MPDHLNRYKDINDYIDAKSNIFRYGIFDDISIFNKDNKFTKDIGKTTPSKRYWVSTKYFKEENGCFVRGGRVFFRQNGKEKSIIDVSDIAIAGEHNLYNALFCVTVSMILKVGVKNIRSTLGEFTGLHDRLELIRDVGGIKYYNDTTSTTPEACIAALKTIGGSKKNITLIAGGSDKKLDFSGLGAFIKRYCNSVVLLGGSATKKIKKELIGVGFSGNVVLSNSMNSAVKRAIDLSVPGDIVLLSPSATSFGMFDNEFDRGEKFKTAVFGYPQKNR